MDILLLFTAFGAFASILAYVFAYWDRIKYPFCKHEEYYEYWTIQQCRARMCKKCGLVEDMDMNKKYHKIK